MLTVCCMHLASQVGDVLTGTVKSLKRYGALVDIGCNGTSLLHISQISQNRVKNVSDVLSEGDEVKVMIIDVDMLLKKKIGLSTKMLESTPGEMLMDPAAMMRKNSAESLESLQVGRALLL